jgi:hypothetical protein
MATTKGARREDMRATEEEEQHPAKKMIANIPNSHQNADTIRDLQDDVSKENMTSKCRHRLSRSLDLSFHLEDLPRYSRSIMTAPSTRKSARGCQCCRHRQHAVEQGFRPMLNDAQYICTHRSGHDEQLHRNHTDGSTQT